MEQINKNDLTAQNLSGVIIDKRNSGRAHSEDFVWILSVNNISNYIDDGNVIRINHEENGVIKDVDVLRGTSQLTKASDFIDQISNENIVGRVRAENIKYNKREEFITEKLNDYLN